MPVLCVSLKVVLMFSFLHPVKKGLRKHPRKLTKKQDNPRRKLGKSQENLSSETEILEKLVYFVCFLSFSFIVVLFVFLFQCEHNISYVLSFNDQGVPGRTEVQ